MRHTTKTSPFLLLLKGGNKAILEKPPFSSSPNLDRRFIHSSEKSYEGGKLFWPLNKVPIRRDNNV
jgi:hypothetical protein